MDKNKLITAIIAIISALLSGGVVSLTMRPAGVSIDENLYTKAVEPNAPIIKYMLKPNDSWIKVLGEPDERSVLFYNLSVARVDVALLIKRIEKLEKIIDPNGIKDPNSVKDANSVKNR
jgi:hypothetical protein